MQPAETTRVAWLVPTAWFYWQPSLSEFTQLFPQTTVFTGRFPGFAKGLESKLHIEMVGETRVIEINQENEGYGDYFTYLSPSIVGYLLRFRPHIIFSTSFGIWTILALLLKLFMGWRVVIAYEGSSPGVDYRNSALRLFVRGVMVKLADACLTNSHAGKDYLIDVLKARPDRVFVKPYEVPDKNTLPGNSGAVKDEFSTLERPIFLFVGQVSFRKGLPLLLQALVVLKERGHEHFTLLIVGDGPKREELEAFCKENLLSDCVQWVGKVPYDEVGSYFHHANVFVLPTLEDTWGVVTLEAMLLGKPILCSKGAGTAELIVHGENGYIFAPDNPETLADLMQTFLHDPESIQRMGEASKQIMEQYTPAIAAKGMADITQLLLGS